ncbi:MAG: TIGR03960 family B12-binding radical SAM protein [Bacteriovoracaceae bacterium]
METSNRNPYFKFLDQLEKPARYIGDEHFIVKKAWIDSSVKVALCFPDTYEIGMSHLGMKILYNELNREKNIIAERVFAPWVDLEKKLREDDIPLVSLENFKSLNEFDIVGFSLQYEMTYTNILNMLDLGKIPVWQKDRKESDPFVICGGPCATHPEPLAPFMDFVVVGDGEDLFIQVTNFIYDCRLKKMTRAEILNDLSKWTGIYVPSVYETYIDENSGFEVVKTENKIKRFFVPEIKSRKFPDASPIPHLTAIFDRFAIELARGCTEGCRFCQAGMIYRPVRERDPEDVKKTILSGLKKGGFDEASLTCLSTADYSAVTPLVIQLLDELSKDNTKLGISSLRAYGLDEKIYDKLALVKNSSLTFAPEAGSDRMRKVINKNISEVDMLKTAENVFSRGWQKMKLYFMIGLPTETDEDVAAIMDIGNKSRQVGRKCGVKYPEVNISVSTFVPKPHTPFQWAQMISLPEIQRKQEMLWGLSKDYRLNFRKHFSKISILEGIIARGDRKIADLIFNAWKNGARFDGWDDQFKYDVWVNEIEKLGLDLQVYLGTIRTDAVLPWSHIDVGLEDRFLLNEWKRAVKNFSSPPCGKPQHLKVHHSNVQDLVQAYDVEKKKLVCYHCGIKCDLKGMIEKRKDFLTTLKSFTPEVAKEKVEVVTVENQPIAAKNSSSKILESRAKRGQTVGYKYRLNFSKVGAISFISHLDLQKIISRIFKRCDLEVLFSEGYNQRPLISFGPALNLGISSLSEYFDVRVPHEWTDRDAMLELLNKNSERGIIFNYIEQIDQKTASIQDSIKFYKYFIPLIEGSDVENIVKELNGTEELIVKSYSKKDEQYFPKNIRDFIVSIDWLNCNMSEELQNIIDEVSPCKNLKGFEVVTKVDKGTTIRPTELIEIFKSRNLTVEKPIKLESQIH